MRRNKNPFSSPIAPERMFGGMIGNRLRNLVRCCLACGKYSTAGCVVSRFLQIVSRSDSN